MSDFMTPRGCRVRTYPATEFLGKGLMLHLSVPSDGRFAEVYLDPASIQKLRSAFEDYEQWGGDDDE